MRRNAKNRARLPELHGLDEHDLAQRREVAVRRKRVQMMWPVVFETSDLICRRLVGLITNEASHTVSVVADESLTGVLHAKVFLELKRSPGSLLTLELVFFAPQAADAANFFIKALLACAEGDYKKLEGPVNVEDCPAWICDCDVPHRFWHSTAFEWHLAWQSARQCGDSRIQEFHQSFYEWHKARKFASYATLKSRGAAQ